MGVADYDASVVPQLIEFVYRHTSDLLDDSRVYAEHCDRKEPNLDDVRMAVQTRVNFSFMQPPSREVVLQLTQKRNAVPLPLIPPKHGIRLPPEKYCLTSSNFQFK